MGDPKFSVFVEQVLTKPAVYYPSAPVSRLFADECQKAREYVMFGEKSAQQALTDLEALVNLEWDRVAGGNRASTQ